MAGNEVVVKFLGDAGGLSKTISGVSSGLGSLGKTAGIAFAGIAAGAAAVGGALVSLGGEFADATNEIIVGTGASGEALEGLQADMEAVATSTPASIGDVSVAIADLNTRLGLTGEPLQDISTKMLDLTRLTGGDLSTNIANVTRLFGDQGIATEDQALALDKIFEATKQTGIGLERLTTLTVQYGAPLRQLGFGFEEQLALFGKWEKEGVNLETVMAGLRAGIGKFAKAGEEPAEALQATIQAIKDAGTEGEATQIALETFGQRAGPDLAAAVREGRFEIDDMVASLEGSGGSLDDVVQRTTTWREQLQVLSNRFKFAVKPAADFAFNAINEGANRIIAWWDANGEQVTARVNAVLGVIREWWDQNGPAIQEKVELFIGAVVDLFGEASAKFEEVWPRIVGIFESVVSILETIWARWGDEFMAALELIKSQIGPLIDNVLTAIEGFVRIIEGIVNGDWAMIWEGAQAFVDGFIGGLANILNIGAAVIEPILIAIADLVIDLIIDPIAGALDFLGTKLGDFIIYLSDIPGEIGAMVSDFFDVAADLGSAVVDGIVSGLTALGGAAQDIGSTVVSAIKSVVNTQVIDRINSGLEFTIDPPGPGPTFNINPPDIPRLAQGGLTGVNDPFMAIIGDNPTQREIVSPEGLMREVVREESGGGSIHIGKIETIQVVDADQLVQDLDWLIRTGDVRNSFSRSA